MPRRRDNGAGVALPAPTSGMGAAADAQLCITDADVPTGTDMEVQERRTLATILDDLVAYQDTREMAQTDGERAEIAAEIATRQQELIGKVDRYAAVMRRMESEAAWEKSEAERHTKRRKRYEAAYAFLERFAIDVMHAQNVRALEGRGAGLKLRQGPGALVVTAECDVPMEYKAVTVTMPMEVWDDIVRAAGYTGNLADYDAKVTVSNDRAKRAIKAGADVPGADIVYEDGLVIE